MLIDVYYQIMQESNKYNTEIKNEGINKMITLSEAYRKLNNDSAKGQRYFKEARIKVNDNMIPAALRQYFTISDYEPELGEYEIGDVVDQNEVLAYLEPTPEYKDTLQIFPLLLKPILPPHARRGVYSTHPFVANVINDRIYYVTDDDIHAELGESVRRPSRRNINENANIDYMINYVRSHTLAELVGRDFAKYFQLCDKPSDSEYQIGDPLRSRVYFEGYVVGFVEPKPTYKGKLKPFYYLRGKGSFIDIVDVVDGKVEYLGLRELRSQLGESKMPSSARSRRKVN